MENAALRVQLVAFQRKRKRPTLTSFGRYSGWGYRCCEPAGAVLRVYARDTVVCWQRERGWWPISSRIHQPLRGHGLARLLEGENLMRLSQVSRSQFGVIHPSGNLLFEFIETAA
jgi:hypothetical protein